MGRMGRRVVIKVLGVAAASAAGALAAGFGFGAFRRRRSARETGVAVRTPVARLTGLPSDPRGEVAVATSDELAVMLRRVAREVEPTGPILVMVTRQNGDEMGVGLGDPFSVLTFGTADREPPYLVSKGRWKFRPRDEVVFFFKGQHTQFDQKDVVPFEAALTAVLSFVGAAGPPQPIPGVLDWDEV